MTTDLITWTPVTSTTQATDTKITFTEAVNPTTQHFYRVIYDAAP